MEEGVEERLRVQDRMIEAAEAQADDPGWSAKVTTAGLNVTYTWQHVTYHPFTNRPMLGDFYTVEAFCPWTTLVRAPKNPLLALMSDILKAKKDYKV